MEICAGRLPGKIFSIETAPRCRATEQQRDTRAYFQLPSPSLFIHIMCLANSILFYGKCSPQGLHARREAESHPGAQAAAGHHHPGA